MLDWNSGTLLTSFGMVYSGVTPEILVKINCIPVDLLATTTNPDFQWISFQADLSFSPVLSIDSGKKLWITNHGLNDGLYHGLHYGLS